MTIRTGHLIKEKVYLIIKNPYGPNTDVGKTAPAGTKVVWNSNPRPDSDGTNAKYLDSYGGVLLHWIDLPEYGEGIGAELGVDFAWDDEAPSE